MKYVMRMRATHHRLLAQHLQAGLPSESVAFLFCRRFNNTHQVTYLVQEVLELNDAEYMTRAPDIASISPSAMSRAAQFARENGYVIVMAHIHPCAATHVEFSQADHIGNQRSFRFFHNRVDQAEHIALVWNSSMSRCEGIAYLSSGQESRLDAVTVVDEENWRDYVGKSTEVTSHFSRQALLLGQAGQSKLSHIKVAIIGLGGLGSLISMAAVHHGFRHLVLVDDDILEQSNLPRIVGASPGDVAKLSKVQIAESYARRHAPSAVVETFVSNVERPAILEKLAACDVVIACTDNTTSRAFLTQFGNQYLVPLLDLGVQFSINSNGEVVNEIGRINLSLPGTPCLTCTGHINPARLAAESIPLEERERNGSYLRGLADPQPSMMAFNMEIVGRGMQVLMGYFSGLFPTGDTYELRSFIRPKGGSYSRQIAKKQRAFCPVCSIGGVLGQGPALRFSITSRAT